MSKWTNCERIADLDPGSFITLYLNDENTILIKLVSINLKTGFIFGLNPNRQIISISIDEVKYYEVASDDCPPGWIEAKHYFNIEVNSKRIIKEITVWWESLDTVTTGTLLINGLPKNQVHISKKLMSKTWIINDYVCSAKILILTGIANIKNIHIEYEK